MKYSITTKKLEFVRPVLIIIFAFRRFVNTPAEVQRQALQWLQKLCLLNIPVPLTILFDMFGDGIDTLQRNTQGYETDEGEEDLPVDPPTSSKKKAAKKNLRK